MTLLDVQNLRVTFDTETGPVEAVRGVSFSLGRDRLGIVVFAGEAYVQLPITTDYGAAKMFLESISPKIVSVQGTDIAAAINKSLESFGKDGSNGTDDG